MSPLTVYVNLGRIYHEENQKEMTAEALGDMWRKFADYVAKKHAKVGAPSTHTLSLFPLVIISHAMSLVENEDYDALEEMSKRPLDVELKVAMDEAIKANIFKP